MYKCNITNKTIEHKANAILTFIVPTLNLQECQDVVSYLDESELTHYRDVPKRSHNHIYYHDAEYSSLRLNIEVINRTDRLEFIENDVNIKSLSNIVSILHCDYLQSIEDGDPQDFIKKDTEEADFDDTFYCFDSNKLKRLFDLKEYDLCLSYIVNNIEYIYVSYYESLIKLHFNLISSEVYDKAIDSHFTEYNYDFNYENIIEEIGEIGSMYECEDYFNQDKLLGLFENLIPNVSIDYNINNQEDFKNVMIAYTRSCYIELIMRDMSVRILPAVCHTDYTNTEMFKFLLD